MGPCTARETEDSKALECYKEYMCVAVSDGFLLHLETYSLVKGFGFGVSEKPEEADRMLANSETSTLNPKILNPKP